MSSLDFPLFADGWHLTDAELLACQALGQHLPERKTRAKAALSGSRTSLIKGRGMEFAEVRPYQQGDDVRTIDWRVTARTGKAHTKLFIEERERPIFILLDLSNSLYFGSTLLLQAVQAAHVAATLGWQAIAHGDRLGGIIAGEQQHLELKPKARKTGIMQLIAGILSVHKQQLEHFQLPSSQDPAHLARACLQMQQLAKPGALIWLISDGQGLTHDCQAPLMQLKRHCDIGCFLMTDPLRQGTLPLPEQFELPIRHGEQTHILTRQSYQAWLSEQQGQQQQAIRMLQQLNITTKTIDAGIKLAKQWEQLRP